MSESTPGSAGGGSPCRAEPASPQGLCQLPLCPGAPRPRLLTPTGEVPSPLLPDAPQDELRTGLAPPFTVEGEARRGRRHRGRPWGGTWWPRPGSRGDPGGLPPPGRHRIVTGRTEKETPQETPRAFRNTTNAFKSLSESDRVSRDAQAKGQGPDTDSRVPQAETPGPDREEDTHVAKGRQEAQTRREGEETRVRQGVGCGNMSLC